jgi:outer membrane immunogenic protein
MAGASAGAILIGVAGASGADVSPIRIAPIEVMDWSGFYYGLALGWGRQQGQINDVNPNYANNAGFQDVNAGNAFLLGGKLGYNFRMTGPLVLGVEADVTAVFGEDATCSDGCDIYVYGNNPALTYNIDGVASLAARLGWAPTNRSMFYGLLGVAVGAVRTNHWDSYQYDGHRRFFTGWTAGLGGDMMMTHNVSIGIEGRYYDLGSQTRTDGSNETFGWHPTLWTITVNAKHYF